jgi:nitrogen regulatory protein PII-like uncharacterized protein
VDRDGIPVIPEDAGTIRSCGWDPEEQKLAPPRALLDHLRREPQSVRAREFADLHPERVADYVFEGRTSVDAFVATERIVVVIEGKRTEAGPTTSTKWMEERHQILRNIDSAWEIRAGREVFGFFIVEGKGLEVPAKWKAFAKDSISEAAVVKSLPHRNEYERAAILRSFLGVTTWQHVCERFAIPFKELPNELTLVTEREAAGRQTS